MIRFAAFVAALVIALLATGLARAGERVLSFHADIEVARDGTITVRERIRVRSEGIAIMRGIFRDIPTIWRDRFGNRVRVHLDVIDVRRENAEEPFAAESISNGVRIRIGDPEMLLEPGIHTYTIAYVTSRQIGFFDGFDELYWNVTGNGWAFPIDEASATVRLPEGTPVLQSASYTGPQGATGTNAVSLSEETGVITFRTSEPLGAEEGLTIAVGFEKGVITAPTEAERTADFFADNASTLVALAGMALVVAYYLWAWRSFGMDPARGVIVPLFAPPQGLSPAAVRYVRRMGYDSTAFGAAIIDLAVRKVLTIEEREDGLFVLYRRKDVSTRDLPASERALTEALFSGGSVLALKQENHGIIGRAGKILQKGLRAEHDVKHFVTNVVWFGIGVALTIVMYLGIAFAGDMGEAAAFMAFWIGGWSVGCAVLLRQVAHGWREVFDGRGSWPMEIIGALFMTFFALPFLGALGFALWVSTEMIEPVALGLFAVTAGLNVLFFFLLKAPTAAGAKLLDAIDGFRMYLETAERERLRVLHPPEMTPEIFERFLPYALALDVENEWTEAFAKETAAAAADPDAKPDYRPGWYSGTRWDSGGAFRFMSGLGAGLSSAAAASASPPGSSSGSGGGGSSGGGGGGGGGGGW